MSISGIVLGTRGQGKSTLAKSVVKRYHTAIFYFDPNVQYYSPLTFSDPQQMGELLAREHPAHFEIVFRPRAGQIDDDFSEFVEAIRGAGMVDNFGLVIDEASILQSPYAINAELEWSIRQAPQSGRLSAAGQEFYGVTVIQTSHRPIDYHGDVRSLVSDWWIFETRFKNDRKWILENLPADLAAEVSEACNDLKRFQCIHVWFENGRGRFSVWRRPERWRVAITAANR